MLLLLPFRQECGGYGHQVCRDGKLVRWKATEDKSCKVQDGSLSFPLSVSLPLGWEEAQVQAIREHGRQGPVALIRGRALEVSRRPNKPGVLQRDKKLHPWSLEQIEKLIHHYTNAYTHVA